MDHSIKIEPSARKYLSSLDVGIRRRIMQAIDKLSTDPRPSGCKKLKECEAYRIRIGDYRVIYEVHDDVLVVLVIRVAHRSDVYNRL